MTSETELDETLSQAGNPLVQMMRRIDGDIAILGIGGKMGLTLGAMAVRAIHEAGVKKRVIGISRFSDSAARDWLEEHGVETIPCNLMDPDEVAELPDTANIIYMVGRKFGTAGSEPATWAINTVAPANICRRFSGARIVVFSTGCVYPLVNPRGPGCNENTQPGPVGEYAQACLGRERIFEYYCDADQTPTLLFRLNYAIDLRYGALHDIAKWIWEDQPVPLRVPTLNCIWQRDANESALLSLEHCRVPAQILNVTGEENLSVRDVATRLAKKMGKAVTFEGKPGDRAYLADASKSAQLFGSPEMPIKEMIDKTADWIRQGGVSLGKPTHFEVSNGQY